MLRRIALAAAFSLAAAAPVLAETIKVKPLTGSEMSIQIALSETVESLMQEIVDKGGPPADQQRLVYAGKQLEPGKKLSDYAMTDGASVMLITRARSQ